MDFNTLKENVELGLSQREIATKLEVSHSTIRHWLTKYNLTTIKLKNTTRQCPCCKESLPKEAYYARRGKEGSSVYCKDCTTKQTIQRQRELKDKAIQYKGGKCTICEYNKYQGALEFHHIDPKEKDFSIGTVRHTSFDKIKSELDKCILLCANCHREVHANLIELAPLPGLEPGLTT